MLEISILRVENPSCIWGRIVKGPGVEAENFREYDDLQVRMNLFYHDVNLDVQKLKPSSINEGQVCVVYWSTLKNWCRATVESLFLQTEGSQAKCFLVDHGEHIIVSSDDIRAPLEKFLQLPFWVKRFQLARIHPMSLRVSICEEKAELVPSNQWDSSATRYLHNLLQATNQMEAVLRETQADSTAIELYLTIKEVKICVNDDLVTKRFACYSSVLARTGEQNEVVDRSPAILACDIFADTDTFLATKGCTIRTLSPRRDTSTLPLETERESMTDSMDCVEVSEKSLENDPKPYVGGKSKAKYTIKPPGNKLSKGRDTSAAHNKRVGSEEDTDSSIVAALCKNLNLFRFLKFLNPASSAQNMMPYNNVNGELDESMQQDSEEVNEGETATAAQHTAAATASCHGESNAEDHLLCNQVDSTVVERQASETSPPGDLGGNLPEAEAYSISNTDEELACARYAYTTLRAVLDPGLTWTDRKEKNGIAHIPILNNGLLQWLNPDPLNPDTDSPDDSTDQPTVSINPSDPWRSGVLVHSDFTLEPCTSLANAPISDISRRILMRLKYSGPAVAESYCWPAVARGSDTVLISHNATNPLTYIPPFLAHMQYSSVFSAVTSCTGPIAVILCPGWEKIQTVYDLLEENKAIQTLHPMTVLVGLGKDEAKAIKIPNNCLLVVTTPFSLVRLLAFHCFLFLRLCHLVLDEADLLFSQAPEEMATILKHFQKVASSEERVSCPKQIVAVGKCWSSHMEDLLTKHMSSPTVIITGMEEAALYGNVHQMILMCLEDTKIPWLLRMLDFTPDVAHKTLVIANSAEEVEHVFKAMSNTSVFCLKTHEGLTHQFDFVIEQWRKSIGPGTHVTLVTTNDCMKALGIRDATCVIHYGFPKSAKLFGSRLFCMSENFRNLTSKEHAENSSGHPTKSVLLISERNTRHMTGVLRYLKRTDALLPPELLHFAQGVLSAKEEQKNDRPLCSYLKSFGVCRNSSVCPDRHKFSPSMDQSLLPDSGTVAVLPLYINTASTYYGRIVRKQDDCYESMASEMASYYAMEKLAAKEVVEGGLYGVQEDKIVHRVKVTSVPDKGDRLFSFVLALFVDEGREQEVKTHQLLQLPAQFHSLPPQAVEIIVCKVKPIDAEANWNPKVTRAISQKIRGLQHQAKIVRSLGNTIFVDPMVRMVRLPKLKTFVYEYNVVSEILNTGMGASNEQHLQLLEELCQGTVPTDPGETTHITGLEDSVVTPKDKMQAAEEALAQAFRAAEARHLCGQEVSANPAQPQPRTQAAVPDPPQVQPPLVIPPAAEPPKSPSPVAIKLPEAPTPSDNQPKMKQWERLTANLKSSAQRLRNANMSGPFPQNWMSAVFTPCENGLPLVEKQMNGHHIIGVDRAVGVIKPSNADSPKRFHPQIKWFQKGDSLIVNVKLTNPVSQKCEFYHDRVVYSGSVDGRHYRADLELHSTIAADKCSWEMKCNEPVLKLVKEQRGGWNTLLKHKNNLVSCDFDHFEDDEKTPNGVWILGHTGENGCYVNSESGSESD